VSNHVHRFQHTAAGHVSKETKKSVKRDQESEQPRISLPAHCGRPAKCRKRRRNRPIEEQKRPTGRHCIPAADDFDFERSLLLSHYALLGLDVPRRHLRQVPECRVQGSGFRVQGSGFRVQGSGFRVQGSGFRVQGLGFRV